MRDDVSGGSRDRGGGWKTDKAMTLRFRRRREVKLSNRIVFIRSVLFLVTSTVQRLFCVVQDSVFILAAAADGDAAERGCELLLEVGHARNVRLSSTW